nr:hypothetical protein B0A51_06700 [Rachicladosporium sp. CCFEE 5018]
MATAARPVVKTEDFNMDNFFDFNQSTTQQSPVTASSSRSPHNNAMQDWNALSPYGQSDERQQFSGPSHDYTQHRQQVGIPVGSMSHLPMQPQMFDGGYNTGIDMTFDGFSGYNTGFDLDTDMTVDFGQAPMPPMFFPPTATDVQADAFVDPNSIGGQEETSRVGRLWPGMHSQQAQQAAMEKAAQTHAMQHCQQKLQVQHQQFRQVANSAAGSSQGSSSQQSQNNSQSNSSGKRPAHVTEPHVEESISRLLNQMRQNSSASGDDGDSPDGNHSHISRMRKDEEEMDEDERLLASDEGKKLSSKERRQLRNKVSARAFRSRRKEYIGQLEGEVAVKVQEASTLRSENTALMQENERYRGLIETLLRHPAFTPFINDISKDPSVLGMPQMQSQPQQAPQPTPAPEQQQQAPLVQPTPQHEDIKPEFLKFDASQLQLPQSQPQQQQQPFSPQTQQPRPSQGGNERVGLAMIPENDFSKLNLNGFQAMNFNQFRSVNAFAVLDVPVGPCPVEVLAGSGVDFGIAATEMAPGGLDVLLDKLDRAARRCGGKVE